MREGRTMDRQEDVEFLRSHWRELRKAHRDLERLDSGDLSPVDEPTKDQERCARLADQYGLDGDVFCDPIALDTNDRPDYLPLLRRLKRQMNTIRRTVAAIESAGKPRYGPDPDKYILFWDGEPYKLTRMNWRFLLVVWGRHNVPFADVFDSLWDDDRVTGNRIHQLIKRTNDALTKLCIDLAFTSEGEAISPIGDWPE